MMLSELDTIFVAAERNGFANYAVERILDGDSVMISDALDIDSAWQSKDRLVQRLALRIDLKDGQINHADEVLAISEETCADPISCLFQGEALDQLEMKHLALEKWRSVSNIDIYYAYLGSTAYEENNRGIALEHFARSWDINPRAASQKSEMFLSLCSYHRGLMHHEMAELWCQQAVASNENYWSLLELGRTYLEFSKYDQAIAVFEKAIYLNPENEAGYRYLGLSLMRTGRPEDAFDALYTSVELQPDSVWARLELGDALTRKGEYALAACQYSQALQVTDRAELISRIQTRLNSLPVETLSYPKRCN